MSARPAIERFLAKVVCLDDDQGGCWVWIAGRRDTRYGDFARVRAHRWSYEHFVGPIPIELEIDHLCRNTLCVNPEHLEAVTHAENVRRGDGFSARNARKTHCPQGHEYTAANTALTPKGQRRCRTCRSDRGLARRAA